MLLIVRLCEWLTAFMPIAKRKTLFATHNAIDPQPQMI